MRGTVLKGHQNGSENRDKGQQAPHPLPLTRKASSVRELQDALSQSHGFGSLTPGLTWKPRRLEPRPSPGPARARLPVTVTGPWVSFTRGRDGANNREEEIRGGPAGGRAGTGPEWPGPGPPPRPGRPLGRAAPGLGSRESQEPPFSVGGPALARLGFLMEYSAPPAWAVSWFSGALSSP